MLSSVIPNFLPVVLLPHFFLEFQMDKYVYLFLYKYVQILPIVIIQQTFILKKFYLLHRKKHSCIIKDHKDVKTHQLHWVIVRIKYVGLSTMLCISQINNQHQPLGTLDLHISLSESQICREVQRAGKELLEWSRGPDEAPREWLEVLVEGPG